MADFKISGRMKIKTLKDNFKEQFGSTIRVYNGVKFADDGDTIATVAKKSVTRGQDVSANGRTLVGNFEKQMNKIYGIKIQVATRNDSELVANDVSLTQSGKI